MRASRLSSGGVDTGHQDRPVPAVNIANFLLGREKESGNAIALLYVDEVVSQDVLAKLTAHHAIKQAKPLVFNVD